MELLKDLGAEAKVVELDREKDGAEMQHALGEISKQRTVPNVFVGGEHIGGNDATKAAHKKGTLLPKLKNAGALRKGKGEATKVEALTTKDTAKVDET
jgi:glutaredoxin 3